MSRLHKPRSRTVGSRGSWARVATWCLASSACASPPPPQAPTPKETTTPPAASAPEELAAQASWQFHPREAAYIHHEVRLDGGARLFVGNQGQRWWAPPASTSARSKTTIHRAPESLQQVLAGQGGRFFLLGESGAVYESASPLGPLQRGIRAKERIVRLATNGGQLLATGALGTLFRKEGERWVVVPTPTAFYEIAARNDSELIALSFPERLWSSRDAGQSWQPLSLPRFAAFRLKPMDRERVHVEGLSKNFSYDGKRLIEAQSLTNAAKRLPPPQRGPDAQALRDRRATIDGVYYYEAVEVQQGQWRIASGRLDGELTFSDPPKPARECDSVRLGGGHGRLVYACVKRQLVPTIRIQLLIFISQDRGKTWNAGPSLSAADSRQVAIVTHPKGSLWMSGVCSSEPCKPRAPIVLDADWIRATVAPELFGSAGAPVFSADGTSSYFLGARVKDRKIALFVSTDGKSFASRPLDVRRSDQPGERWRLHMSEEGELGLTLNRRGGEPIYALLDDDGARLSTGRIPKGAVTVSANGGHVFAVGRDQDQLRGPRRFIAWRSLDAGRSFSPVELPTAIAYDELELPGDLWCNANTCVIGRSLSRLAWRARTEEQDLTLPQEAPPTRAKSQGPPPLGRTVSCLVPDHSLWRTIEKTYLGSLPSVQRFMQGRSMWSTLRHDADKGLVEWVSMPRDSEKLERFTLLDAQPKRSAVAIAIAPQMEGFAAARIKVATAPGGGFGRIDLGWVNTLTHTRARARLKLGSKLLRQRADLTLGKHPTYLPSWISVSPHALLIRPSQGSGLTLRVNPDGSSQRLADYPEWPAIPSGWTVQSDAVITDKVPLAMGMAAHKQGSSVLFGKPLDGTDGALAATSLAPPSSTQRLSASQWTYKGGRVGVAVTVFDRDSRTSRAYFAPFTAAATIGEAERLPSFAQLGLSTRSCTEYERKTSTRYLAPAIHQRRHLFAIDAGSGPIKLELRRGVFYGDGTSPCVAAWHARTMGRGPAQHVIVAGDGNGWLFRGQGGGFAYQRIVCTLRGEGQAP